MVVLFESIVWHTKSAHVNLSFLLSTREERPSCCGTVHKSTEKSIRQLNDTHTRAPFHNSNIFVCRSQTAKITIIVPIKESHHQQIPLRKGCPLLARLLISLRA